jgi:hypothetical protein
MGALGDTIYAEGSSVTFLGKGLMMTVIDADDFEVTGFLSDGSSIDAFVHAINGSQIQLAAVPEPSSIACFAIGALGLIARRRKRS